MDGTIPNREEKMEKNAVRYCPNGCDLMIINDTYSFYNLPSMNNNWGTYIYMPRGISVIYYIM
jgi:hypothetical protein